ncbi:uncharacterized protein LOC121963920 [Plectropomus leopardus]|uniref:uncharacterized protein LOC121963920 n=1 Tax=Plectropomus leopardus TaxID=160734 RepID=UPI001C4C386A|nr:uncharacterized protein LOC121963920 [Plectropomus leopardus]
MYLPLLFTLSLCWWAEASRSLWSDTPTLLISSDEIEDGESVRVSCLLPIDYRGGLCRLYREHARKPFKVMTATDYICVFTLSSRELLGKHPVGSRVLFTCDYHLQQYTSVHSDIRGVTVWGSSPRPALSASRRFASPYDSVEVTCTLPLSSVSSCQFYSNQNYIAGGSCNRNLTGTQLAIWEKPGLLLAVNLTCRYHPERHRHIRSEPSAHTLLFVVGKEPITVILSHNHSQSQPAEHLRGQRDLSK